MCMSVMMMMMMMIYIHTEIIEQCMYVAGGGNGTSEQKQCQGHPSEDPGLNNQAFQCILINVYLLLFKYFYLLFLTYD